MPRALVVALIVLACTAGLQPASAQESNTVVAQGEPDVVDIVFTEIERRLIRDYYERIYRDWDEGGKGKHKNKGLPPGLARKGSLPPGLAKQLVQNGSLPPGLAKRLPSDLTPLLPLRPDWQDVVIVDDRVMLIRRATNLILDIILIAAADADE